ncbi:hypothetical protein GLOIN_2v719641 [Rhizophagus clarus]|uniref:HMG box domain-containing protein n=1 Tax=Rhizophagus clarus TaxID=94130 RepID=A0A8H3LA55_9GLOM|nr:hypothetical protein GLOIN_2v719641 [Rhizophagus clarus]
MEEEDLFKDYQKSFEVPLSFEDPFQNEILKYSLNHNIGSYDHNRFCSDPSYSKTLYDDHLVEEDYQLHRPTFPPEINIEEYVNENENNKKIKDMSKMNSGNSFMVYRKYLHKHMQISGINLPMKQLSQLASALWRSEPSNVKDQ